MEQMDIDNYIQRIEKLEDDELELRPSAELFIELLALYMYRDELIEAKNLLQRIPTEIKGENKEITQLIILLNALNSNNTGDFFQHINYGWSDLIKDIMQHLKDKILEDVLTLVGNAYASILEQNILEMTQMTRADLKRTCLSWGWSYEEENQQVVIIPVPRQNTSYSCGGSKHQMFKLTEFVTFLEN